MKARFPLREAKVEVQEIPGKPGSYNAVAYLRPWLQMEELTTSLRMVARIPAAASLIAHGLPPHQRRARRRCRQRRSDLAVRRSPARAGG